MATQVFNVSQTFAPGTWTSAVFTVPSGYATLAATVTAGPMSDPATQVSAAAEQSNDGGVTWFGIGGLTAQGGTVSSHGGPSTPVTATAQTNSPLIVGTKLQATIVVSGPDSVAINFAGSIS